MADLKYKWFRIETGEKMLTGFYALVYEEGKFLGGKSSRKSEAEAIRKAKKAVDIYLKTGRWQYGNDL